MPQNYDKELQPIMSTPGNDVHINEIVYVPKFIYTQRLEAYNLLKLKKKSGGILDPYWIPFPEYKQL